MACLNTEDKSASLDDTLAFLALTSVIDDWNHKQPDIARDLLYDSDQQLLTELWVAHLMPSAQSLWWNGDNARRAYTELLFNEYPFVRRKTWKCSKNKAKGILEIWRKDAARLFSQLVEGERRCDEPNSNKERRPLLSTNQRSPKRKGEDALVSMKPKKAKKLTVPHSKSTVGNDSDLPSRYIYTPSRPKRGIPQGVATAPRSDEWSPITADDDSDSEDQEPLPMGRRRRRGKTPCTPRKPAELAAAAYPSPLTVSPVRTVASIQPVEASPQQKRRRGDDSCMTNFEDALDFVSRARDDAVGMQKGETEHQFKKLSKKVKGLRKMIKNLQREIRTGLGTAFVAAAT